MNKIVTPESIAGLIRIDPEFGKIQKRYGPPPNWQRPLGFASLARMIIEQHVSLESAGTTHRRLTKKLGSIQPGGILSLTDQEMKDAAVSRQKARYLRALSESFLTGRLDMGALTQLDDEAVRKKLTAITGIGPWTADIYLLFCLQRPDVLPVGDVAIIQAIKDLTGLKTKEEVIDHSQGWSPYRSCATYFLWHYYLSVRDRLPVF